jgi:hypothetical protein
MSGVVSGINYGLLFGTGSSTSNIAASMLATLYGGATASTAASTAVSTGNPLIDLKLAEQNESKDVAREATDPTVVRDLAAFKTAVANAKDIGTALENPNVLKVLLTANGLGDQVQYAALAGKALLSNPSDPTSLVNKLSDTRWKTVAQNLNLASGGLAALQSPAMQAQIASAYERVTWLNSLDQATPGLSQAIEFKQQASGITSVDQILGDPVNREVVLTALGIPEQIAFQDLTAQEQAVSSRLDVSKLQDPTFVSTLTDQYLLAKQTATTGGTATSITSLAVQASGIFV